MHWLTLSGAGIALHLLVLPPLPHKSHGAEDILARSRATYAGLTSYADTGTVLVEYGTASDPTRDRHGFHTYYRTPRWFYFDFVKGENIDRLVLWMDPEAVHYWWWSVGTTTDYPKGQGAMAFVLEAPQTSGTATDIAALLFSRAGLTGSLDEFGDPVDAGIDKVDGHDCHKLVGRAQAVYGQTGHVSNVRRMTVWIDAETSLVRRIYQDWAATTPAGKVSRMTTTFSPHANPPLDAALFTFVPPTAGR
jgi:outer membrane lipoprotein-sorting protein